MVELFSITYTFIFHNNYSIVSSIVARSLSRVLSCSETWIELMRWAINGMT